jgi:hypothetical protein
MLEVVVAAAEVATEEVEEEAEVVVSWPQAKQFHFRHSLPIQLATTAARRDTWAVTARTIAVAVAEEAAVAGIAVVVVVVAAEAAVSFLQ